MALLATAPGPAAGTAGAQAAGARLARAGQERGVAVTVLTGDKVLLRHRPGGRHGQRRRAVPRGRGASPAAGSAC
ncbi:MAG TPA: hypothetical protein VLA80_12005 [Actinomycetota bacterium]|nr:hypothetical protein [Actinomycetota bacterium]